MVSRAASIHRQNLADIKTNSHLRTLPHVLRERGCDDAISLLRRAHELNLRTPRGIDPWGIS